MTVACCLVAFLSLPLTINAIYLLPPGLFFIKKNTHLDMCAVISTETLVIQFILNVSSE